MTVRFFGTSDSDVRPISERAFHAYVVTPLGG